MKVKHSLLEAILCEIPSIVMREFFDVVLA